MIDTLVKKRLFKIDKEINEYTYNDSSIYFGDDYNVPLLLEAILLEDNDALKINNLVSTIFHNLEQSSKESISFSQGLIGYSWLLIFLENERDYDFGIETELQAMDNHIFSWAKYQLEKGNYDFFEGGVGALLYYLERFRKNECEKSKIRVLANLLLESAIKKGDTHYWVDMDGSINLGMAHGMASILMILSMIHKNEILDLSLPIRRTINYYLSMQLDGTRSIFPSKVTSKAISSTPRLGWCYGDLPICLALWNASKALEDERLLDLSEHLALLTIDSISFEKDCHKDASLCHGTAANYLLYNRWFINTSNKKFLSAAKIWLQKTLDFESPKNCIGNYGYYTELPNNKVGYIDTLGYLEGVGGIHLTFNSFLKQNQVWDRILLLS